MWDDFEERMHGLGITAVLGFGTVELTSYTLDPTCTTHMQSSDDNLWSAIHNCFQFVIVQV